eukprot:3128221-Amphidinium_carterae.1
MLANLLMQDAVKTESKRVNALHKELAAELEDFQKKRKKVDVQCGLNPSLTMKSNCNMYKRQNRYILRIIEVCREIQPCTEGQEGQRKLTKTSNPKSKSRAFFENVLFPKKNKKRTNDWGSSSPVSVGWLFPAHLCAIGGILLEERLSLDGELRELKQDLLITTKDASERVAGVVWYPCHQKYDSQN